MWTWLAIVITVTTSTLGDSTLVRAFSSLQELLAWLLVLSFAATVAGSFRRERENGVLELLLISPLSARRIILGRLLGLWGQFLPAVVLFVFVWAYISQLLRHGVFSEIAGFLLTFATLPIIGLYFSLRCQSFIAAFLMTLITGVLLPSVFSKVIQFLLRGLVYDYTGAYAYEFNSIAWLLAQSLPILLALMAWTLTHSRLEQRRFSFERITA
jgi:ABC-type transport system involved in multi-copper enzyme maturation permease subunit